jgi:hypothetical protein
VPGAGDPLQVEPKERGRWWPWIVVTIILLAAGWAVLAGGKRDEFAFLSRFHPTRVSQSDEFGLRRYALIFPKSTSGEVAKALRREMPLRGWVPVHRSATIIAEGQFVRGHLTLVEQATYSGPADYYTSVGGDWFYSYNVGESALQISVAPETQSWFDRQRTAIRAWLHIS